MPDVDQRAQDIVRASCGRSLRASAWIVAALVAGCGGKVGPRLGAGIHTGGTTLFEGGSRTHRGESTDGSLAASGAAPGVTTSAVGGTPVPGTGAQADLEASGGASSELEPAATGGSSDSGSSEGGSSAGHPGTGGCGPHIDDMEEATGRICEGEGRKGVWYAFNDEAGEQTPAPTEPGVPILPELIPEAERYGDSKWAMHTFGEDCWVWGAGIGFDLSFDGATYGHYDATTYRGISFWGRSTVPTSLAVRVSTALTTSVEYGGVCSLELEDLPCNPCQTTLSLGPTWSHYTVDFANLADGRCCPDQFERSRLTNIQFLMDNDGDRFDFWIDDVSFEPAEPERVPEQPQCPTEPPPGCEGEMQFRDPVLEAVVRGAVGQPAANSLRWEHVCHLSSLCATGAGIARLDGLECLTSITTLRLAANQLTDIDSLGALAMLTSLDLSENDLTQIDALGGLSSLEDLRLTSNEISQLEPLSGLTRLGILWASVNRISDLGPLVANPGLGADDQLLLYTNLIDCDAQADTIEALRARNISLGVDCPYR